MGEKVLEYMGSRNCKHTNMHTSAWGKWRQDQELNPEVGRGAASRERTMATRGCFFRALGVFISSHVGSGTWACFPFSPQPVRSSESDL